MHMITTTSDHSEVAQCTVCSAEALSTRWNCQHQITPMQLPNSSCSPPKLSVTESLSSSAPGGPSAVATHITHCTTNRHHKQPCIQLKEQKIPYLWRSTMLIKQLSQKVHVLRPNILLLSTKLPNSVLNTDALQSIWITDFLNRCTTLFTKICK